jgi:hypothetical protein
MTETNTNITDESGRNIDPVLATVLMMKEWFTNKERLKAIRKERISWYGTNPECTGDRKYDPYREEFTDGKGFYDCTCEFCTKRNQYYNELKQIANRQRALMNTIRHRSLHCC